MPWLTAALGLAVVCATANLFLNDHVGMDTAKFYTRMASQFGQGHYDRAFFHSMPPLVPMLAGLFCKVGLDSWTAMKLVSGLFFTLSVYWAYRVGRLRLEPEHAQWCALLFVSCPRLLRYGMAGQLEAAKMFFVLLACEQVILFCRQRRWRHLLVAGMGGALLALSRNEGLITIPLVCLLLMVMPRGTEDAEPAARAKRLVRAILPIIALLVVCLVIWSPWMYYQYKVTGYPSLGSKLTMVAENILHLEPSKVTQAVAAHAAENARVYNSDDSKPLPRKARKAKKDLTIWQQLTDPRDGTVLSETVETWKGLIPYLLIPALIWAVLLIRRRRWEVMDTALAILFVGHIILLFGFAPSVIKRLIVPYVPFYFPWTVLAVYAGLDYLRKAHGSRPPVQRLLRLLPVLIAAFVAIGIWDGMSGLRNTLRGKEKLTVGIARWVEAEGERLNVNPAAPLQASLMPWQYYNGSDVVIASLEPVVASLADVDWCGPTYYLHADRTHEQIIALLRKKHVDLIIVDENFLKRFPLFDSSSPDTRLLSDQWRDEGVEILALEPIAH